jgi:AIR synthase-related protein
MDELSLPELAQALGESAAFRNKCHIKPAIEAFADLGAAFGIQNGDDAAAIPDGDGFLLLAAEGIIPSMLHENPHMAGLCAVLANVNDIYAMGGRPLAMVDVIGTPDEAGAREICRGLSHNAARFRVPVVGGHVLRTQSDVSLSVAILGKARKLITSFAARPGDRLVLISNAKGQWLSQGFWNCTLECNNADLVANLEMLPQVAELGLVRAGKDVSMAGIAGTTVMLAESSGLGACIDLDRISPPQGVALVPWLLAFMSYGFVLAVDPAQVDALVGLFRRQGLDGTDIGSFHEEGRVLLARGSERAVLWDFGRSGFAGGADS